MTRCLYCTKELPKGSFSHYCELAMKHDIYSPEFKSLEKTMEKRLELELREEDWYAMENRGNRIR